MVVREFKSGNATIRIHDDSVVSKEEAEKIIKRIGMLIPKEKAPAKAGA